MLVGKKKGIGILGGSFDPPHKGHLKISNISLKKIKLKKIYWIVTKKNPFKKTPHFSLKERILRCHKITQKNSKIKKFIRECKLSNTEKDKLGFNTEVEAEHPITKKVIPVYIANFVKCILGSSLIGGIHIKPCIFFIPLDLHISKNSFVSSGFIPLLVSSLPVFT